MTVGVIAAELPPERGGMQEHARATIAGLASDARVVLYTSPGLGLSHPNVTVVPAMTWRPRRDRVLLATARVDVWLTLNAGLAPLARDLTAPLVAVIHGNDFVTPWLPGPDRVRRLVDTIAPSDRWRGREIASALRAAEAIVAVSAFSRRECARRFDLPEERIRVVPPGIAAAYYRDGTREPSLPLRLVTVARLDRHARRKNVDGVLEAIALLRGELDLRYAIVGSGDERERLERRAAALGIGRLVRFLGDVDRERIVATFHASDLFVMPVIASASDVEGFGMVYAEAAATGLPSLATRTGGTVEAVRDGESGILLSEATPAAIAEGLRRFARTREAFPVETVRAAARPFHEDLAAAAYVEILEAAISRTKSGRRSSGGLATRRLGR